MTAPCLATVVIPTCEGGPLLAEVVTAVLDQETPWPFELLVIDSSSTDGSIRCLEGTPARLLTISRETFNHGETRNLGAREARGRFVVFLVQDATPVGRGWLRALVEGLEAYPEASGGYARQVPRPDADPRLAKRLSAWTPPGETPVVKRVDPGRYRELPAAERIRLAAFDNVCSVVRRERLLEHPFPRRPFGEDLCWGEEELLAGRPLVYLPAAVVCHSHRRSFRANLERSRIEHTVLREQFGLRAVPDLVTLMQQWVGVWWRAPRDGVQATSRELAELLGQYLAGRAPSWPFS